MVILEKAGWVKRDISSSLPRWPRVGAIKEMERMTCSRRGLRRRGEEDRNGASAVDEADGVLCAARGGALVVVVGVLVEERTSPKRVMERARRGGKWRADLCCLVQGGKWVRSVVPAERKRAVGGQSDVVSVVDCSGCQE